MFKVKYKIRYIGRVAGEKAYLIFIEDEMYILYGYYKKHYDFDIIKFNIFENITFMYELTNLSVKYNVIYNSVYTSNNISGDYDLFPIKEKTQIVRKVKLLYIELYA